MAQSLQIPVEINLKTKSEDFDKIVNKIKNKEIGVSISVTNEELKKFRNTIQNKFTNPINIPISFKSSQIKGLKNQIQRETDQPVKVSVQADSNSLKRVKKQIAGIGKTGQVQSMPIGQKINANFASSLTSSNAFSSLLSKTNSISKGFSIAKGFGSSFFKGMGTLAQATSGIFDKVVGRIKRLTSTISGAVGNIRNKFNVLNSTLARGLSLAALVAVSKKCLELSSDLAEVQNVVDTTFGKSSNIINDFAENALRSFGLTELQAKKYASTLGAIAKASGESDDATLQMSTNLTKLTADVASFFNYDYDTAFEKIRSGLTGETEPLKDLGVVMTVANLEQYRLAQGIKTAYSEMSSAEQMALRYNYIMQALTDAQGDFNKTQASWANQLRVLQGQAQQLGAILGNLLQKVLYPVLSVVNVILGKAVAMGNALAKAFGFDTKAITESQNGKSETGSTELTDTTGSPDLASTTDKEAKSQNNLAKSTKRATAEKKKQNKEREKELSSVHKLNILNKKQKDSTKASTGVKASKTKLPSAGKAGVGALGFDLLDYADIADKGAEKTETAFENFIKKLKDLASRGDFEGIGASIAEQINKAVEKIDFDEVDSKLVDFVNKAARVLNGFVSALNAEQIGEKLGAFFNVIIHTVNEFYDTLDFKEIGTKIADGLNGLFATVDFSGLGEFLTNKFNAVFQLLSGFVTTFDWIQAGNKISELINSSFNSIDFDSIETTVINGVNGIITALGELVFKVDWGEKFKQIGESIGNIFSNINFDELGALLGQGLVDVLDSAIGFLEGFLGEEPFSGVTKGIKTFFGTFFDGLKTKDIPKRLLDLINGIVKNINDFLNNIDWGKVNSTIKDIVDGIFDFILGLDWLGIIKGIAHLLASGLTIIAQVAIDIVDNVFGRIVKAVGNWMSKVAGKIKDAIITVLNTVKQTIANVLNKIPGVNIDFGDGNGGGGGRSFASDFTNRPVAYSSRMNIPHLAKGAVIPPNNKFLAMLGDQTSGTNIETPLGTMVEAFKTALSDSNYNGMGDIYIPIYVNNELTSEELIRKQEIERYRSNGKH